MAEFFTKFLTKFRRPLWGSRVNNRESFAAHLSRRAKIFNFYPIPLATRAMKYGTKVGNYSWVTRDGLFSRGARTHMIDDIVLLLLLSPSWEKILRDTETFHRGKRRRMLSSFFSLSLFISRKGATKRLLDRFERIIAHSRNNPCTIILLFLLSYDAFKSVNSFNGRFYNPYDRA